MRLIKLFEYTTRKLAAIAICVVCLSILISWVSWSSTKSVSDQIDNLAGESVPQLRVISNLSDKINEGVLLLYVYYATLDNSYWKAYEHLRSTYPLLVEELNDSKSILNQKEQIQIWIDDFDKHARSFDLEMKKGRLRSWDTLREHLANSQKSSDMLHELLSNVSEEIREKAITDSELSIIKVDKLTFIQLGFSLSVIIVAIYILLMLRGRLKDQKELYKRAYFDELTGLPNRKYLEDHWSLNEDENSSFAFLLINLDHYHLLSGTFGHATADLAIKHVASRWKKMIESHTLIMSMYQYTTTTWLIVVKDCSSESLTIDIAKETLEHVSGLPLKLDSIEFTWTCSIGISFYPNHGNTIEELIRNADSALYQSQKNGTNSFTIFNRNIKEESERLLSLENKMRDALQDNEFELFFQPQFNTNTNNAPTAEALIRWRHKGELISPAEFIPIAERSNLIISIGDWVIYESCRLLREWLDNGNAPTSIAINVSPTHFMEKEFVDKIKFLLERYELLPCMLELEVTEEAMITNQDLVISKLRDLKELGVSIAIDDFGTGYSSLSYIRSLPVDILKIDQSFVRSMDESSGDYAIVHMIIELAKKLSLKVIAEGVETENQKRMLINEKCDILQGYLISKPLSAEDYSKYLAETTHSVENLYTKMAT